jgi:hypothetical protein
MGLAKRHMEEIEARGWADSDLTVCSACVLEEALVAAVVDYGGTEVCGFCGASPSAASAPLEVVIDGKAIKIASMIDEHTRESLLHLVERSITAERLVTELERVFAAAGGPPKVLRMDNGPELISQALQPFRAGQVGLSKSAAPVANSPNQRWVRSVGAEGISTKFDAISVLSDAASNHSSGPD